VYEYPTISCGSCGKQMIWTLSPRGARLPLDAEEVRSLIDSRITSRVTLYRIEQVEGQLHARPVSSATMAVALTGDEDERDPLYLSHFATCPQASTHTRKRGSISSPTALAQQRRARAADVQKYGPIPPRLDI